jgi:hypothetical protein
LGERIGYTVGLASFVSVGFRYADSFLFYLLEVLDPKLLTKIDFSSLEVGSGADSNYWLAEGFRGVNSFFTEGKYLFFGPNTLFTLYSLVMLLRSDCLLFFLFRLAEDFFARTFSSRLDNYFS